MNLTDEECALAKAARRKWAAEYRRKHPERIREANNRYWARRALREQAEVAAAEKEEEDGEDAGE